MQKNVFYGAYIWGITRFYSEILHTRLCMQSIFPEKRRIITAKQGMRRYDGDEHHQRNDISTVPELQGKAKSGKERANPIIAGTHSPALKVYHTEPYSKKRAEKPISSVYSAIDNDLARDNLENDITAADLQDM